MQDSLSGPPRGGPDRPGDLAAWIIEAGLAGLSEIDLLRGFCERLAAAGMPLDRATAVIDTLHPVHEGRAFVWDARQSESTETRTYGPTPAESWRRSIFYHLLETGGTLLRRNLARGDPADFPRIAEAREEGYTDHVNMVHRLGRETAIGEMDCVYSAWATRAPEGFADEDVRRIEALAPSLALAIKCASLARVAETLVETYLGRDAGRRVLSGRIARGVADEIGAVLWFSDLHGYTGISDTAEPHQIIPFLNDYAEAIISAIHEAGGDVLKLIGDGTLAIFQAEEASHACLCALKAERLARERVGAVNARRRAENLPVTEAYLGLHVGTVFYGNIGSHERLDFTVVGPAVNEVSRIAALCRSVERGVLLSSAFVAAAPPEERERFVSVGRYALRGVSRAQDLFTLDPESL
jgi:adenylate cyclase